MGRRSPSRSPPRRERERGGDYNPRHNHHSHHHNHHSSSSYREDNSRRESRRESRGERDHSRGRSRERREDEERKERQERSQREDRMETNDRRVDGFPESHPSENSSEPPKPKEKANYEPSGKLAAESNTFKGVVLKYAEPPEARKPTQKWRVYVFKGDQQLEVLYIHRQSAYLIGRDRLVADLPVDHPSCSKQHAVIQYRFTETKNEYGDITREIKPYLIDLGSGNGTKINGSQIEAQRYYEIKEKDVVNFALSTRDYVFLHDMSE